MECPFLASLSRFLSRFAYIGRWGSWRKALQAFVDYVNDSDEGNVHQATQNQSDTPEAEQFISTRPAKKADAEQRHIKFGLRYKILKRDRFRCVLCGRSPATNPSVELQVDHIIHWSKGGKTVADNLQATCRECNIGKGNKSK